MTKDDMMIEWRKQRGATASSSEIGQRPLYDNMSDSYQPSGEFAFPANESIICCKHGIKCSEYYGRKFDKEKISSLWPVSELVDRMEITSASSSTLKSKESYVVHKINSDQKSRHENNQYDNISVRCKELAEKRIEVLSKSNADEILPENASKLEVLRRFYLGQRSRSTSFLLGKVAQSFRLYHELPENVSNVDNLKHYAPLYIVFVNNNLEYRHLPIQECFVNGKRRLFVECGDKDILLFKKLEYLIRHYANAFAYIDSQGRRSRFPDNPVEASTCISNKMN
ncbi:PAN2-PAN3 deadenylation complex subunit [Dirofilaria immitis]